MEKIDVSIIIVNFNTNNLVRDCILSIQKNTKNINYEIIIVNNGDKERLKNMKNVKIINTDNQGFSKANNIGIDESKGKYILLLNSDTIVKQGSFERLVEFAEKHTNNVGAVVPRLLNKDGTIQPSCFRLPTIGLAFKQYILKQGRFLDKYYPENNNESMVDCAVMACFLITPIALRQAGKLNEKYFMYFEDIEYCKKIKEAGLKIYYLPDSQVEHLHGGSGAPNKYLIDSAKKYHGLLKYYIFTFILWIGQKI